MKPIRRFLKEDSGASAIFLSFLTILGLGGAALVIDIGQMSVLKTQMQNSADASAMAAARYLNGTPDARVRAEAVARNAAQASSAWSVNGSSLVVEQVVFYASYGSSPVVAQGDHDAKFIEVRLQPREVSFIFQPVLELFFGSTSTTGVAGNRATIHALAVAGADPFICHAPPLMICDPEENSPSDSLDLPGNVGRQFRLKSPQGGGNSPWAPGNFGLLALPTGENGASAISAALAAVQPTGCYTLAVETATGSKTNQVKNGINARFDLGQPNPAPNVITYPRDLELILSQDARFGSGTWASAAYWLAKHGSVLPLELVGATRFQVYLYELGETFARDGKQTLYPVPTTPLPPGFTLVEPPGPSIPTNSFDPNNPDKDGVPSVSAASNGAKRRLVQVAVLQCVRDNVRGNGEYPTDGKYAEFFITEYVKDPPDAAIYGEFVRRVTTTNSPDFRANVRLVK